MAAVRRRVRRLLVLDAVGRLLVILVGTVIALGLADYLIRYQDRGLRVMSSAALMLAAGWAFVRLLWPVLRLELGDVELSLQLEARLPILRDRLASAMRFLRQREDDVLAGSTVLRRSVIVEATAEIDRLRLEDVVQPRFARRAWTMAAASFVAVAAIVVLNPPAARTALARLLAPWGKTEWPKQSHLAFVNPVQRLAAGQTFEVELKDSFGVRLPDKVLIQYRFHDASSPAEISEPMRLVNDVMAARKENVVRPFQYRAIGGDDFSMDWIDLEVVEPPRIDELTVTLRFPDYTGWPPETGQPHIRALVGTHVELRGRTNKPVGAATVHVDEGMTISAALSEAGRWFTVPGDGAAAFKVERSSTYWIELVDVDGFSSGDQVRYEIRAVEDFTPTVNIAQPPSNIFVSPAARVPVRVAAKDDLALSRIALKFSRSDQTQEDETEIKLYQGGERPLARDNASTLAETGDSQEIVYDFDVAALAAKPGTVISLFATASDYFPHHGQSQPVRLTVITADELRERLAERQNYIVSELTRLLKLQRDAHTPLSAAEIQFRQIGHLERSDVDHLQSADLLQRQVERGLVSPGEGVISQVAGLLDDLAQNKVDSPDVERQMQSLLDELVRLGRDELPVISGELTAAIKAAQIEMPGDRGARTPAPEPKASAIASPLFSAGRHQDEVIETLERLTASLAASESYRRFHSEIATVRRQQIELNREAAELGRHTLTRELKSLTLQERTDLAKLAARQLDLARQFDKIQQRMQQTAEQSGDSLAAGSIADALSHARERGISQALHEAGKHAEKNQFGQATQAQRRATDDLQEMLDILSNRREHELSRLVKKLRDVQDQLARLQTQQGELRKKSEAAANESSEVARRRQLERLTRDERDTAAATERVSRTLQRLQADRASHKASQGAASMNRAGQRAEQGDAQATAGAAAEAQRDLDEAQQELAKRLAQAEADLAQEQMARLEDHLKALADQQQRTLEETRHYADVEQSQGQLSRSQAISVGDLAKQQQLLVQETAALAEKLAGTPVFRAALAQCAENMQRAATLLDARQVGEPTQKAEELSLALLTHSLEALHPAADNPAPDTNPDEQGEQGDQGGQQNANSADATQVLAELKLLKWMQDDVNRRTKVLEDAYRGTELPPDAQREYQELGRQQGLIAELTLKLAKMVAPQGDDGATDMPAEDE
jgi:hypothetical protein